MHLDKLLHTESGKYLMSMLLGFGIATIFRSTCKGRNCLVFNAPPLDEIDDKIFQYNDKCYKYKYKMETCTNKKRTVEMF
jgi:hypothetical protein